MAHREPSEVGPVVLTAEERDEVAHLIEQIVAARLSTDPDVRGGLARDWRALREFITETVRAHRSPEPLPDTESELSTLPSDWSLERKRDFLERERKHSKAGETGR